MTPVLSDLEIKEVAGIIEPLVPELVRGSVELDGEQIKTPPYGLEPHGYIFRLDPAFTVVYKNRKGEIVEAKGDSRCSVFFVPPGGIVYGRSLEHFQVPGRLVGVVVGLEHYAKQGALLLGTVLSAGWQGHIPVTLVNLSHRDVPIFPGWGIGKVIFLLGGIPLNYFGKGG